MKKIAIVLIIFALFLCSCTNQTENGYSYNEQTHYKQVGCGEKTEEGRHVFTENNVKVYDDGYYHTQVCSICGYVKKGSKIPENKVAVVEDDAFDTLEGAIDSLDEEQKTIILIKNYVIEEAITLEGKNFVLNLNGNTVTCEDSNTFILKTGSVVVKNGKVESENMAFRVNGKTNSNASDAVLTLSNDLDIVSNSSCCVFIYGKATLNTNARLTSRGEYAVIQGNGNSDNAGTIINVTGGRVYTESSIAMYVPQACVINISAGEITGQTALYIKSGTINITGGYFMGTGGEAEYDYNGNGADPTGDAVVIDNCGYPGGVPVINVSNGNFMSSNAKAIASYATGNYQVITGFITGGRFNSDITEYVAEGYRATNVAGVYTVDVISG